MIIPFFLSAQNKEWKRHSIDLVTGISLGHRIEGEKFIKIKNRLDQDFIFVVDSEPLVTGNYYFGLDYKIGLIKGLSAKMGTRFSVWHLANDVFNFRTGEDRTTMTYLFIEVPLIFQYKFGSNKIQPFIELGGSPMFFLQNKSSGTLVNAPDVSFLVYTGVGLSYQFTERNSISMQVLSRFQLQEYSSEYFDIDLFPFEIGLEIGTSFYF